MKITSLPTTEPGVPGLVLATAVDFTAKQSVCFFGPHNSRRIMVTAIRIISKGVDTLSNGASVSAVEASRGTWTAATSTITSDATAPSDGATVAVGSVTYTFKTTLTGAANEVLIGSTANAAAALTNLKAAINATAGAGSTYGTDTVINPDVTAGALAATTLALAAKAGGAAGNSLAVTKTGTHHISTYPAFSGGMDGTSVNAMVASTDLSDTDDTGNIQVLTLATGYEVVTGENDLMLNITTGSTATADVKDVAVDYVFLD